MKCKSWSVWLCDEVATRWAAETEGRPQRVQKDGECSQVESWQEGKEEEERDRYGGWMLKQAAQPPSLLCR